MSIRIRRDRLIYWMLAVGTSGLSVVVVDVWGASYIQRRAEVSIASIARERSRVSETRRPLIIGKPLEQNAANWYRLAFMRLTSLPPEGMREIRLAAEHGFEMDPARLESVARNYCGEAESARADDARRSVYCDWGFGYRLTESGGFVFHSQALRLGYCTAINGHLAAARNDPRGAARAYVNAVALSADLARGDLSMNLIGTGAAKVGLNGLSQLITSVDNNQEFLAEARDALSRLDGNLPTTGSVLRFPKLWIETGLVDDARSYVNEGTGVGRLLPRRAIAAWRLNHSESLVRLLDIVTELSPSERGRVVQTINHDIARSGMAFISDELPAGWDQLLQEGDQVRRLYRATSVALTLESWYVSRGEYPIEFSISDSPTDNDATRYEPLNQRKGYQLSIQSKGGEQAVTLKRHARHD